MRLLIWFTFLAAALYAGFWLVASRAVLAGAEAALEEMRAEERGDYQAVRLVGFPSRFDVTIDAPELVSADGWLRWRAPFVQVFALSYRPNHIIAVWPETQGFTLGPELLTLGSGDLRASAVFGASTLLPLDHAQLVGSDLTLRSDRGWSAAAATLRLAIAGADDAQPLAGASMTAAAEIGGVAGAEGPAIEGDGKGGVRHRVGLVLGDLTLRPALAQLAGGSGSGQLLGLGAGPSALRLDAVLGFDAPLDRAALATPPALRSVEALTAEIGLGGLEMRASGALDFAAGGLPEGRITLETADWRGWLAVLVAAGAIRPELAPTYERAFEALAAGSEVPGQIRLPLVLRSGKMSLGPLPLGPIPGWAALGG